MPDDQALRRALASWPRPVMVPFCVLVLGLLCGFQYFMWTSIFTEEVARQNLLAWRAAACLVAMFACALPTGFFRWPILSGAVLTGAGALLWRFQPEAA